MPKKNFVPQNEQKWIDARKRFHLSHAQIQMARELGMDPSGFGKLANHAQEPWKTPLPEYIEELYFKRFGQRQPDVVQSIEERIRERLAKNDRKRQEKRAAQSKARDPGFH